MHNPVNHVIRGVVVAAGLGLASGHGLAVAAEADALPAQARAMTAVELYRLYRGKTWQWQDGAGRLQDEGRVFRAWSGADAEASWAEGRWLLTNEGQLCLKAVWHGPTGSFPDKTCFSHRINEGTVYQKKEPSGAWYVFKHASPGKDDEYGKLIAEDTVSAKVMANRPVAQATTSLPAQVPVGAN